MKKSKLINAALFTPMADGSWGLPLILWGLPGVAKTAVMHQLEARYGLPLMCLSPAEHGEGAFGVTPFPVKGKAGRPILTYPAPEWTERFLQADGTEAANA